MDISECINCCCKEKKKIDKIKEISEITCPKCNLPYKKKENVLFITAHPDDESMFFGPSIVRLVKEEENKVHLLCLSTGDSDGLGNIRSDELKMACKTLGMEENDVHLLKGDEEFKDGFNEKWSDEDIAKKIDYFVTSLNINLIITFDEHGISGHPNHKAVNNGVKLFKKMNKGKNDKLKFYFLESVNTIRKYIGVFDIYFSVNRKKICYLNTEESNIVYEAMKKHKSQLVWFRKIYMITSRYMYLNTLCSLPKD